MKVRGGLSSEKKGRGRAQRAQTMHAENGSNRVPGSKSTSWYSSVILMEAVVSPQVRDLQEGIYLQRGLFSAFLPWSAGKQRAAARQLLCDAGD